MSLFFPFGLFEILSSLATLLGMFIVTKMIQGENKNEL
jgi:hypothetical protein